MKVNEFMDKQVLDQLASYRLLYGDQKIRFVIPHVGGYFVDLYLKQQKLMEIDLTNSEEIESLVLYLVALFPRYVIDDQLDAETIRRKYRAFSEPVFQGKEWQELVIIQHALRNQKLQLVVYEEQQLLELEKDGICLYVLKTKDEYHQQSAMELLKQLFNLSEIRI